MKAAKTPKKTSDDLGNDVLWKSAEKTQLLEALLSCKNKQEIATFLRDILTKQEIDEFSRRLEAASMLDDDLPYTAIIKKTGLSSTTVARISKWLRGPIGGYRLVLGRMTKHHHATHPSPLRKGLS